MEKIESIIKNTKEENVDKVNWTKAWSSKYPILKTYQKEVNIEKYAQELRKILKDLQDEYGYSNLDSMLVLKDILYHEYKNSKRG